ncbi:glycosyltransferase family 4 protein [Cloacibacillus evryensis]|uniref:Glycosyltransferase family 4 protein n=1 Tax=Cloacibacillus evryensis TaxID=508460 RepID=A0AAW5JX73_9BACT|nr:glycosyltransferase family 4 protein [Cloacibacillus evryensis]MCQ4812966.1 glycosyltransferase family 4 protein [Cloacibacillus evryensis]
MNILFLTIAYNSSRNIYSDLMNEFRDNGHDVWVVCQTERRNNRETHLREESGINILRVKTGNLTDKVSIIEKGLTMLSVEYLFKAAIKDYLSGIKFDLVIYSTPPITFCGVVNYIKKRDGAVSYLLLKDIFPQNAVDLGMIKNNSLIHKFFMMKEKKLYAVSDYIGCLSKANVKYLIANNKHLDRSKIEVNPNSIKPMELCEIDKSSVKAIRGKYGIPDDATLFVYGGNLGLPQGLDFLVDICKELRNYPQIFLLIIGNGNRYESMSNALKEIAAPNVMLRKALPKDEYDKLLSACDVGLIFLSPDFTIPNFPSRLTAYMETCLPVLAATDEVTDIKDALLEAGCGMWSKSGDLKTFMANMKGLAGSETLRRTMGRNGRRYLEEHYTVDRSYKIIVSHFEKAEAHTNV